MSPQTETKTSVGFKAGVKDYKLTYYTPEYETKDTDQEASYKNSSNSYYGNRDNSETEKDKSDDELLKIIKEENKNLFWFEKHPLVILFDYKRWNHEQDKMDAKAKVYEFFNDFYAWYYEELTKPDEEIENLLDELYAWWYDKHNNSIYELEYSNDDYEFFQ